MHRAVVVSLAYQEWQEIKANASKTHEERTAYKAHSFVKDSHKPKQLEVANNLIAQINTKAPTGYDDPGQDLSLIHI